MVRFEGKVSGSSFQVCGGDLVERWRGADVESCRGEKLRDEVERLRGEEVKT